MITQFGIRNFKSIASLTLGFAPFNCFIGMNGAGKSSILQALDFAAQLFEGHVDEWLAMREWTAADLNSKLIVESNVRVGLQFETASGMKLVWSGAFNRHELACSGEIVRVVEEGQAKDLLLVRGKRYRIGDAPESDIPFTYQGSILSQLKDSAIPDELLEIREFMRRIRSLELLAPNLMRRSSRVTDADIGAGGEKLSAFLFGIKGEARERLVTLLQDFYPTLVDYRVISQKAGWKKLVVTEKFGAKRVDTEARHVNDGLLRVLAMIAQIGSDRSMVLLDEVENGINPEIVERLVDVLVAAPQQIIVTTHSPMILNYMEDDVAASAVQFVYRTEAGGTRARKFFEIPQIAQKLELMGPGEAFVDTDLVALANECAALDLLEEKEKSSREQTVS